MQRSRTIAAAPVRSADEAWRVVVTLLAQTMERSPAIETGSVAKELAALDGLGPALIAAGHLGSNPLTLVDGDFSLDIRVETGDAALGVEENLNPVPGGAQLDDEWILHLPTPTPLVSVIETAVAGSDHLVAGKPSNANNAAAKTSEVLDLDAIRGLGAP